MPFSTPQTSSRNTTWGNLAQGFFLSPQNIIKVILLKSYVYFLLREKKRKEKKKKKKGNQFQKLLGKKTQKHAFLLSWLPPKWPPGSWICRMNLWRWLGWGWSSPCPVALVWSKSSRGNWNGFPLLCAALWSLFFFFFFDVLYCV